MPLAVGYPRQLETDMHNASRALHKAHEEECLDKYAMMMQL